MRIVTRKIQYKNLHNILTSVIESTFMHDSCLNQCAAWIKENFTAYLHTFVLQVYEGSFA